MCFSSTVRAAAAWRWEPDASTVPFCERFGFRYAYTRENSLSDNYPPIVENGVLLKDMQVLSLEM